MVQRVADRLRGRAAAGQAREGLPQPGEQLLDERAAPGLAGGLPDLREAAPDLRLYGVEGGDAPQGFGRDRCRPALRQRDECVIRWIVISDSVRS